VDGDRLVAEPRHVVLSPHLDDAVFSAWHVVTGPGPVRVVNVFAGLPGPGVLTPLDRAHGARNSDDWMRRRRDEDRAVHALTGCETVCLDLLDVQYRADRVPDLRAALERDPAAFIPRVASHPGLAADIDGLRRAVAPWLVPGATVYASTGIGRHPDHRDVGRLGLALAREGWDVRLYADSPYYLRHGIPSWAGREENRPADDLADEGLRLLSPALAGLRPTGVDLGIEGARRKIDAATGYRTEFSFIDEDFGGIPSDPELMRHEACWALP
jgi:hypothetical protein